MSKLQRTVKKKRKKTQKPKREDDIPEHLRSFGGKLLFIFLLFTLDNLLILSQLNKLRRTTTHRRNPQRKKTKTARTF